MYLLSHYDSEHQDSFGTSEGNMAAYDAPFIIAPESVVDDDPLEFQGAWCVSVSNSDLAHAFPIASTSVEREITDADAEVSTTELEVIEPTVAVADVDVAVSTALASIQRSDPGLSAEWALAIATEWVNSGGVFLPARESIVVETVDKDDDSFDDDDDLDDSPTLGYQSDDFEHPIFMFPDSDDSSDVDDSDYPTTDDDDFTDEDDHAINA